MRTNQDLVPRGLRIEHLSIHSGGAESSVASVASSAFRANAVKAKFA